METQSIRIRPIEGHGKLDRWEMLYVALRILSNSPVGLDDSLLFGYVYGPENVPHRIILCRDVRDWVFTGEQRYGQILHISANAYETPMLHSPVRPVSFSQDAINEVLFSNGFRLSVKQ